VKPAPAIATESIFTGALPAEVKVRYCGVEVLFTTTLPKLNLIALSFRIGISGFNFTAKLLVTIPCLATTVATCAVSTHVTVAANLALEALAGTTSEAGTLKDVSVLASWTARPPLPAAAVRVTVQVSVADPVMEELLQETALNSGATAPRIPTGKHSIASASSTRRNGIEADIESMPRTR